MEESIFKTDAEAAFSIMFVSVGMSCFIWQSMRSGWMFYMARKPIHFVVFAQAVLGVVVTFVTLLTSLVEISCYFQLAFSIIGVNLGDIALQSVLLWKAYLGNSRSKVILGIGVLPLIGIVVFIWTNFTGAPSSSIYRQGVCDTYYPGNIVIIKAALDFSSNIFLSFCFLLVIYRHYRILGTSVQKTLIKEGLIYCFGVCTSNVLTGILLTLKVLGGSTPVLYTIDWYLASYLIIKQIKFGREGEEENEEEDESQSTVDGQSYKSSPLEEEEGIRRSPLSEFNGEPNYHGYYVPSTPQSTLVSQVKEKSHCTKDGRLSDPIVPPLSPLESLTPTLNNCNSVRWSNHTEPGSKKRGASSIRDKETERRNTLPPNV
ncbi:uncharacterized protein BYT42DRAFT_587940 [Radiomyces spectabilis]|uniref:uncharacterized protein n=1 Tax=Radiomyces spectabilis TaxID=64574 RepID=UPI00221E6323|nr:uncharacterized protein BYT42DRAFT_587940 [Radiomyces spectabilis]KAI8366811.1 hypothetical protein BYT42DRAFT_587940 [Radiomyces spectabilis]